MASLALQAKGKIDHSAFMYDHIGTADGLSSQRVYSMVEDKYGGVWIGIKNGVARYNGRTLHNYTLGDADKRGDTGGIIIKLTKTPDNSIIAYNNKGEIFRYEESLNRFVPIVLAFTRLFEDINKSGGGLILKDIDPDSGNNLWASTSKGIFFVSIDGKTIKRHFNDIYVNNSLLTGKHLIACGTTGAFLVDTKSGRVLRTLTRVNTDNAFVDRKHNKLWLGTFNNGAMIVDMKTWQVVPTAMQAQLPHTPVRTIETLNDTTMMIGFDGDGVYIADRKGHHATQLWSNDDDTGNALHGNGIYDILRDRQGNIWIGSYTGGVDIAYPTGNIMATFTHREGIEQSLMSNGVNDILGSDGIIYFATDRGISILNTKTQRWTHTMHGKVVLTMCKDNGDILAGTYGDGVFRIHADGRWSEAYSKENGILTTNYVFSLLKDSRGNIWIGCLNGPMVEVSGEVCRRWDIETVQCIVESPDGKIAVGTASGFHIIDPNSQRTTHYLNFDECKGRDINNYICTILFNEDNRTVWLGTDGGGIYMYDLTTRKYQTITRENDLPSNSISAMCFDGMGRIIASTDIGIAFVYPKTMDAININFFQGINREYNRMSIGKLWGGRIIFGSNSGAVGIDPALIDKLAYNANLRFANITLNGDKEISDEELGRLHDALNKGRIRLAHNDNSFTIGFECVYYRYRNDILYQYILDGFNENWSEPTTFSAARFTNLPSGNYILKVRAVSRNDKRVLDEKSIEISVDQPWWNSIWAWLVYCAVIATIAYLALKNYRGKLERRYFNEKIDFFVHAAHDIRTPLSLVLAPLSDIAEDTALSEKSRKCLDIARSNGNKLFGMISELLDFQKADVINNPMKPVEVSVKSILEGIYDKFHLIAEEKQITLEIDDCADGIIVSMDYKLGAKLFDNLLSNAIKYTPSGGKVVLRGRTENGKAKIEVSDNGIGIPKNAQKNIFKNFYRAENAVQTNETGSGIGLMLARRIATLHNGKLSFESEEEKGTTFTLTLPLVKRENNQGNVHEEATGEKNVSQSDIILFVDDNADLRAYFEMAFSNKYKVITVENGENALSYLSDNVCDIVVSDVMMPGIQGDELCRRIKDNPDTSWMPVILLTAKATKDFIIEGLGTGADDYVTKPFDTEILRSKIETTLANRRRLSEYYRQRVDKIATDAKHIDENGKNEENDLLDTSDNLFIDKATRVVMERMSDTDFGIDHLCREMAMSRTLFYGKIKTLTAQTPQDFIRNIRLQRAASLLREGKQIMDVCVICGFANTKHFSTVFKKQFGVSPSKY